MTKERLKALMATINLYHVPFTQKDLDKCRRKGALRWHPDLQDGDEKMMKMINMACEELKGEIGKWQKVKTDGTNANHARVMDPITSEPPDMLNATQTNQFLKNMFTQYMKAAEADGDIDSLRWWLGEE